MHEKLQNFMAPEDRSSWSEQRVDELFGNLFGQSMGLGETVEEDEMEDVNGGVAEEESMMLFLT